MHTLATREASVGEALARGPLLRARAAAGGVGYVGACLVRGPAVVLGAAQRAGRVVDLDVCAAHGTPVLRRATSGTAAYVGGAAIVWTLALPDVASLVPDATPRTVLNRNVRGFLRGLTRAGLPARYFGREWISVQRRPAAILGFDIARDGSVLIEVIAGVSAPISLPVGLAAAEERAVDRWRGAEPLALGEATCVDALRIASEVTSAVASRAGSPTSELDRVVDEDEMLRGSPSSRSMSADDPMPEGFEARAGVRVPIGWIDVGVHPSTGRVWLGGDVLAPLHLLEAIAGGHAPIGPIALEGATLADLEAAVRRAGSEPVGA